MIANTEMAAAWDGPEGDHWAEQAAHYEGTDCGQWDRLTATGVLASGSAILDVGCGTGRGTRDAARLVKPGRVLGVDLSARMLDRARAEAVAEGLDNVDFVQADAQVHAFEPGAFDAVVSSYGAMFFADPVAAFANLRSALRPGGRMALLAWRQLAANEWLMAVRDALALGRDLPAPPPSIPGPFGLADEDHVRSVLSGAGFADVILEPVDAPIRLGRDADDAFGFLSSFGITRGLTHELDDVAKQHALDNVRALVTDRETPAGVLIGSASWVITATNAEPS